MEQSVHTHPAPRTSAKQTDRSLKEAFRRFAQRASETVGSPWLFIVALAVVLAWALTGPLFNFSNTWQLVINTGTTIVTFLMVFVIQNTQNRDAHAMHLKLDELLRAMHDARNEMIDLEHCTDEQLARYEAEFKRLKEVRERRERTRETA